jgi:diguanylate cyclase (GGDEF)-like protein
MAAMESVGTRAAVADTAMIRPRVALDAWSLVLLVGTAVGYAALAQLGLGFVLEPQRVAAIWPAAGLAVGLFLVTGPRRWPAVALGIATATATSNLTAGVPPTAALGFVLANVAGPLLAATLLRRSGFRSLARVRDVGLFIACAGVIGPCAGAVLGAASAAVGSGAPFHLAWASWSLSNAGGVLALAPALLLVREPRALTPFRGRLAEAAIIGLATVLVTAIAFVPLPIDLQPSAYTTFLLLVIAAMRFGVPGAAVSTLVVSTIATAGTLAGHGPVAFLNAAPAVQVGQLHVLVTVVFLVAFVTAAAMTERRTAADDLEHRRALEADRAITNERLTIFARHVARSLEADALFQLIAQSAVEVVDADMVRLTVATGEPDQHRIVAAVGAPGAIGRTVAGGDGVTGAVIRDGVLVVRDHVTPAERVSTTRDVMPNAPLAVACAPILSEGAVVATLALARLDLGRPFEPDEVRALELMAELSALALRNAVAFERAHDLSIRDELTGVPNRRYFTTSFEQLAAQRLRLAPEARVPVSAIMFDLDHFGPVNKERGHATGDIVLAAFGQLLAARLRRADVVARYGGEEFVAVLVGTDRDDAMRVADEIRTTFEATRLVGADGAPIRCTVSAGVATADAFEPSLNGLLPTADVALSMAKRAGRNTVSAA